MHVANSAEEAVHHIGQYLFVDLVVDVWGGLGFAQMLPQVSAHIGVEHLVDVAFVLVNFNNPH